MHDNVKLLVKFYSAFSALDAETMNSCYDSAAKFHDPIFKELDYEATTKMWNMLTKNAKDFELKFTNVKADEQTGSVEWVASYTFSKTGRKVVNKVRSQFYFDHGRIGRQFDDFNLVEWNKQALGTVGYLLGWCTLLQNNVSKNALTSLENFTA
jgi:hypothetical protein